MSSGTIVTNSQVVAEVLTHLWAYWVTWVGLAQLTLLGRAATGVGLD